MKAHAKSLSIVIYLGRNVKEYDEQSTKIINKHLQDGSIRCEKCLGPMQRHSSYDRGIKETGQKVEITVVWCSKCRKWRSLLPDFLLPNKHYSGNEVEGVVIDSADTEAKLIETAASESTVRRWIKEVGVRIRYAVGILKYCFRRMGVGISEASIDAGPAYSELEQILPLAPKELKCCGNKLGLANMWLGVSGIKMQL